MSVRLFAATAAALLLASTALTQAQTAAPAPAPAPAPAAAPAPAPAPAPAATSSAKPMAASADAGDGKVAYYGRKFAGRKTANGERFNPNAMTMAHKSLPFGTLVKVTNPKNKRSVVVRVNDRGPTNPGLVGDLSLAAAKKLRMMKSGVIDAKLEVVGKGRSGMKSRKARKA
jgi:rare lipoprotein A